MCRRQALLSLTTPSAVGTFIDGNEFVGQEQGLGKQGTLLYAGPFAAIVELQRVIASRPVH